jgi:N-formylglutamate deformylase
VNHRVGPGETASRFFQPAPEAGSKPSNVCDRGARVPDAAVPTVQWELCMTDQVWTDNIGSGPTIATAVHDGHHARDEVLRLFAIGDEERTREEDPFTAHWTTLAPTRVIGLRSRFEVDLNRPRDKAVYRTPEDAWGLTVWSEDLPDDVAQRSLDEYDLFYTRLKEVLAGKAETHGRFVVFDLHAYNHRRQGVDGPPADVAGNPQVNIGTGTMDRTRWAPVVDRFIGDLKDFNFPGGGLDVRENVKFFGGNMARWIHETFPESGCCISIEFKKFFMDEWTGEPNPEQVDGIGSALGWTVSGVQEEVERLGTMAMSTAEAPDRHFAVD